MSLRLRKEVQTVLLRDNNHQLNLSWHPQVISEEIATLIEWIFHRWRERVRSVLSENLGTLPVSGASENQASFFQLSQDFRVHLRKKLESSGFVWLNFGDFQDSCCEAGDSGIC